VKGLVAMSMPGFVTIYRKTWSGIDVVCKQICGVNRFYFNKCDLVYKVYVDSWAREPSESWEFVCNCDCELIRQIKAHLENTSGGLVSYDGYCIYPRKLELCPRFGYINLADNSNVVTIKVGENYDYRSVRDILSSLDVDVYYTNRRDDTMHPFEPYW
jgi:hypothetical protein